MKVGDLVDYDLVTWTVTAYNRYDFDGDRVDEWELTEGHRKRYLERSDDDGVQWSLSKKIPIGALDGDVRREIIDRDETIKGGIRSPLRIRNTHTRRQVNFLHASFPINFDGRMECLPPWAIQATHSLLYAAGYQALESERPGFSPLARDVDGEINERARQFLPG